MFKLSTLTSDLKMDPADFEFQLQAEKQFGASAAAQEHTPGTTYTDPKDGTVYEWDAEKRGWFPKIDDDFLAMYQASYGIDNQPDNKDIQTTPSGSHDPATSTKTTPSGSHDLTTSTNADDTSVKTKPEENKSQQDIEEPSPKKRKPNEKETPTWFDIEQERNHNIYVSGLPTDVTLEEFALLMSKYGIIMEDENGDPKLKLYKERDGTLKGDGLCCYLKVESVQLAVQLLHESTHRDCKLSVEKAQFQMKGSYDPSLKKKKKNVKKKGKQQKMLDWRERKADGEVRKKSQRIVIFKKVFEPKEFEDDPTLITDVRSDLQEECEKFGAVKKILVFDRHPDGVVSLAFKDFEAADLCVTKMNNRWYAGRQLEVSHWDGLTDFQVEETDKEREQRLEKWEKFLEENTGEET